MKLFLLLTCFCCLKCVYSRIQKRAVYGKQWPNGTVYYQIDKNHFNSTHQAYIEHILKYIENEVNQGQEKSCIRFINESNQHGFIQFSNELPNTGCASDIGFTGRKQLINIQYPSCFKRRILIHEVMHALGFEHEHSRSDRDKYVEIEYKNLREGLNLTAKRTDAKINKKTNFGLDNVTISYGTLDDLKHNFYIYNETRSYDTPYDYFSIMHYNSKSFSRNGKALIRSKHPILLSDDGILKINIKKLSPIDIIQVQRMYNCPQLKLPSIVKLYTKNGSILLGAYKTINDDAIINSSSKEFLKLISDVRQLRRNLKLNLKNLFNLTKIYYLNSVKICGLNYYWPLNYPITNEFNVLYRFICEPKKHAGDFCSLTFQCKVGLECLALQMRNNETEVNNKSCV